MRPAPWVLAVLVAVWGVCAIAAASSRSRLAPSLGASSNGATDTPALTVLLETEAQVRTDVLNAATAEGFVDHAATASVQDVLAQGAEATLARDVAAARLANGVPQAVAEGEAEEAKMRRIMAERAKHTPFSPATMSYANIGYLGRGYNIFEANPREMSGTLDPGYRAPVVARTFKEGQFAGDGRRFVPDHFDVAEETAATFTSVTTTYSSQSEYLSSLDRSVSIAGSVGAKFGRRIAAEARFSASATYQNTVNQMASSSSVYTQLDGITSVFRARLRPTFQLDDAFIEAVQALPLEGPAPGNAAEEAYQSFLDRFGTHITTNVVMGGVASVRYTMTQDSFSKFQQKLLGGSESAYAHGTFFGLSASMSVDASSKMQTDARSTLDEMSTSMTEWYLGGSPIAGEDMKDGNLDGLKLWSLTVPDAPIPTSIVVTDILDLFARPDLFPSPETNVTLSIKGDNFANIVCTVSGGAYCEEPLTPVKASDLKFGDYVLLQWLAPSRDNTSDYLLKEQDDALYLDRIPPSWTLPQNLSRRASGVLILQTAMPLRGLRETSRQRRSKKELVVYFYGTRVLSCQLEAPGECEEAPFERVFESSFPFADGFDSIQAPTVSYGEQIWIFVRGDQASTAACHAQQLRISCVPPRGASRFHTLSLEALFPDHARLLDIDRPQEDLQRGILLSTPHLGASIVTRSSLIASALHSPIEEYFPCLARCNVLVGASEDAFIATVAPDTLGLITDSGVCTVSTLKDDNCSHTRILHLPIAEGGSTRKWRAFNSLLSEGLLADPPPLNEEQRPYVFRILGPDLAGTREGKPVRNGRDIYLSTAYQPVVYDNSTTYYTDQWPSNRTDPTSLRLFPMPSDDDPAYDPSNPYMPSDATYFLLVSKEGAHAGELSFGGPTMPCLGPAFPERLVTMGFSPIVDHNVYSQLESELCLFKIHRVPSSVADPIESKYSW